MFLLYRIYDLAPVKYENLRPEKPQKPPVTAQDGDEEGASPVEDAEVPEKASSSKKGRRTRSRKVTVDGKRTLVLRGMSFMSLSAGSTTAAEMNALDEVPLEVAPMKATKKRRAKKAAVELSADGMATTSTTDILPPAGEDLAFLINQEETPVPIDGGDIRVVEAEEHPEAIAAARNDGDGCGVSNTGKKNKKGKKKRSVKV